jgi:glycosyltransferase involved in cell wall biosynthesis
VESVCIIVPVKDEEVGLEYLLQDYIESKISEGFNIDFIFVVDSRTSDSSKVRASAFSDVVIDQSDSIGKGAAVRQAVALWKEQPTDYVIFMDADGSYSFQSINQLIEALSEGADISSGSRFTKGQIRPNGMSKLHNFGNRTLSLISSLRNARRINDLCTGLWGFKRNALLKLEFDSTGFDIEAEIVGLARRNRLVHKEVGVNWSQRKGGVSKLRSISDGLIILYRIIRT